MTYTIILRDPRDFTCEADYCKPNTLLDDKKFAIWFDDMEKAKDACIKAGGYCVEDKDFEEVWYNPMYLRTQERALQRELGKKLIKKPAMESRCPGLVTDPGEYEYGRLAEALGGKTIKLQPSSDCHINIFESEEKDNIYER